MVTSYDVEKMHVPDGWLIFYMKTEVFDNFISNEITGGEVVIFKHENRRYFFDANESTLYIEMINGDKI